ALSKEVLPVHARGGTQTPRHDVRFDVLLHDGGVVEWTAVETDVNPIDVHEIHHPQTVARRQIVKRLEIDVIGDGHATRTNIVRERAEKRPAAGNDPGPSRLRRPGASPAWALEDPTRPRKPRRSDRLDVVAVALTERDLEDA